jgi:serine/threonine protein kinase
MGRRATAAALPSEDIMRAAQELNLTAFASRYTIVGLIGSGGMGRVYLGRDEQLLRYVAIKVLTGATDGDAAVPPRLLREARMLSRFNHPFVASIFDFVVHGGREYLVMEFVPGSTLKEVMAAGPLPSTEVVRLGGQLARGLAAAHAARVIHRDLKPQNIKITSSGRLKILDFGIAALTGAVAAVDSWAETHSAVSPAGTVPYMSPEQVRGEDLDERTDIFSAGAVLYEMAAGRPAFPQRDLAHLVEAIQFHDPPPVASINPFVPDALERVITKALQKDRERRQPSASMLASELRSIRIDVRDQRSAAGSQLRALTDAHAVRFDSLVKQA